MESGSRWIIYNGVFKKEGEALLPAGSRTVRYGDGCFETFRSYSGLFLHLEEHFDRLWQGLNYLEIEYSNSLNNNTLYSDIKKIVSRNELRGIDAVMRLQVWREGERGYMPKQADGVGYMLSGTPLREMKSSWELATVSTRRISSASLDSRFKLSGGTNYIKASAEALRSDADDALMLTTDGWVSETTIANLFWISGDTVYTPSVDCDLLPGITRGILLQLLHENEDLSVEEGRYRLREVQDADAVWICNSLKEVLPVSRIDDYRFETTHPVLIHLQGAFRRYVEENLEKL